MCVSFSSQQRDTVDVSNVLYGPLLWDETEGMSKPSKGGGLKLRIKLRELLILALKKRIGVARYLDCVASMIDGREGHVQPLALPLDEGDV
jgi:hypothetical protein